MCIGTIILKRNLVIMIEISIMTFVLSGMNAACLDCHGYCLLKFLLLLFVYAILLVINCLV